MIKVLTVLGTRPEAIKLVPVINELVRNSDRIVSRICLTAQHRQMVDQVLSLFKIKSDYDLDLMRITDSLLHLTAEALLKLELIFLKERPDWVLVQGDTTTTMAAAIATYYSKIKLGHVEAGLRTYDNSQPFPEEGNRRFTANLADLHFAATDTARQNLLKENIPEHQVIVTGNTVIDALNDAIHISRRRSNKFINQIPKGKRIVMITVHRRENLDKPLKNICSAIREIAIQYSKVIHIVFPVHLNPCVNNPVHRYLADVPGITLTPPLNYIEFVGLLNRCFLVLTDSGGLQEEAPSLGKPVLLLRNKTERPEAVAAGTVRIVGTNSSSIVNSFKEVWENPSLYRRMSRKIYLYGDGKSSQRIVKALLGKCVDKFVAPCSKPLLDIGF